MGGQASVPPPSSPVLAAAPLGPAHGRGAGTLSLLQSWWTLEAACQPPGEPLRLMNPSTGSPEARTHRGPLRRQGAADWAEGGTCAGCQLRTPPRPPPHPLIVFILQIFHLHLSRTVRATGRPERGSEAHALCPPRGSLSLPSCALPWGQQVLSGWAELTRPPALLCAGWRRGITVGADRAAHTLALERQKLATCPGCPAPGLGEQSAVTSPEWKRMEDFLQMLPVHKS